MRTFITVLSILGIPFIAWLPAKFWSMWSDPWCLKIFPPWLDHMIYVAAGPYLDKDIVTAAQQMEFVEIWISSVIILEIFAAVMLYLFGDKFNYES